MWVWSRHEEKRPSKPKHQLIYRKCIWPSILINLSLAKTKENGREIYKSHLIILINHIEWFHISRSAAVGIFLAVTSIVLATKDATRCLVLFIATSLHRSSIYHRIMNTIGVWRWFTVSLSVVQLIVPAFHNVRDHFTTFQAISSRKNELVGQIKRQNYRWQSTRRVCFLNFVEIDVGHVIF